MIRFLIISINLTILIVFESCEKSVYIDPLPDPLYAETEMAIRSKYDNRAVFTWKEYNDLLLVLSDNKFLVLPLNEMRQTYDNSKIVIGLRHDIDFNPFKALEMAKMENEYGIRATYYILSTSDYYGDFTADGFKRKEGMENLYHKIYQTGAEIGIHNDLLTIMIDYKIDPFQFNKEELDFFKTIEIPVYGSSAHGSPLSNYTKVPNYEVFSDFAKKDSIEYFGIKYPLGEHSLKDFGFEYEAYFLDFNYYISDSGGKWNSPDGFSGILNKINGCGPGSRIEILIHPDWWGKKN